jgi:hypothetical protein
MDIVVDAGHHDIHDCCPSENTQRSPSMFLTELFNVRKSFLVAGCLSLLFLVVHDSSALAQNTTNFPTIGQVEQFDPQL